ncbi:uncharacterized protein LOC106168714 [Lingula anatina]|uniref:Uncharacterized protein LOC106168714 n=1 Tax=Lingula anatina TaxID=7574 RepID=A0A1S3J0J9_LINAN|nr:uncharacterized protein LOC106168714 [Lingula anatina]|eukprot:XP_013403334.1 uncharacterized protein LOC106168714 [Lingula anatina]
MSALTKTVVLSNGLHMPIFGLGTSHLGGYSHSAVVYALKNCGYRHIDTAERYGTEDKLPLAIKESGIHREDIFLTSKLWPAHYGYEKTKAAFHNSLQKMQTDYLDLYLLHWPYCPLAEKDPKHTLHESWRALEDLYDEGKIKAIGVSNFLIPHLEDLLEECRIRPMVNQVEHHPYNNEKALFQFCKDNNIQYEGYCPLAKGRILNEPIVVEIAQQHNKTPAQVLIRWSLQDGIVTIPKSTKESRVLENCQVFDFTLSDSQMTTLHGLHTGLHASWDPYRPQDFMTHIAQMWD